MIVSEQGAIDIVRERFHVNGSATVVISGQETNNIAPFQSKSSSTKHKRTDP
jgi:hypothetical protein